MTMKPQIPERIKDERVRWLTDCAVKGKTAYAESWQGQVLEAVVENSRALRLSRNNQSVIHAVTGNMLHVECKAQGTIPAPGSLVKVQILSAAKDSIANGRETDCLGMIV